MKKKRKWVKRREEGCVKGATEKGTFLGGWKGGGEPEIYGRRLDVYVERVLEEGVWEREIERHSYVVDR